MRQRRNARRRDRGALPARQPAPTHAVVALCAFDDVDAALDAVGVLRRVTRLRQRDRVLLGRRARSRVRAVRPRAGPFPRAARRVRARRSGRPDRTRPTALAAAVDRCAGVGDVAVATDAATRPEPRGATARRTPRRSTGSARRTSSTSPCRPSGSRRSSRGARSACSAVAPDAAVWLFGHAGDGNVHVNVTGVAPDDDRVNDTVLGLVAALHGSISAEHGIGTRQARVSPARAQPRRDRHVSRDQTRARPGGDPQSARACCRRRTSRRRCGRLGPACTRSGKRAFRTLRLTSAQIRQDCCVFCHTGPWRPAPVWLARVVGRSDRPPPPGDPSSDVRSARS